MTTWTRSCPPAEPIAHQPLPWTSPHRSYPSIISLKPHRHSRETFSPHPPSPDSPSWRVESPSECATKLARSYHEQTSPVSSEIYDTPSSNTNIKPGSNGTKFNHEAYISPRTTNQRGPPRPLPPPLTARTTHAGPQEEEATEPRRQLVPQPTGLEASTLFLDDRHRSTPIFTPTRPDTTEATMPVPRRTTQATPTRPHRRTRRRRRINRNHDNLFLYIYSTQHRLSPFISHHTHDP